MARPIINNSPNKKVARPTASKAMAEVIISGGTNTTGLTVPAATAIPPTGSGVVNTQDKPLLRLFFGLTDAHSETVNYQVYAYAPLDVGGNVYYIPQMLAKGLVTAGTLAMPAAIVASGVFCDTITDTLNKPGTKLRSTEANDIATLDVEVRGCLFVKIETDLGTAATAYVFGTLGEEVTNISAT